MIPHLSLSRFLNPHLKVKPTPSRHPACLTQARQCHSSSIRRVQRDREEARDSAFSSRSALTPSPFSSLLLLPPPPPSFQRHVHRTVPLFSDVLYHGSYRVPRKSVGGKGTSSFLLLLLPSLPSPFLSPSSFSLSSFTMVNISQVSLFSAPQLFHFADSHHSCSLPLFFSLPLSLSSTPLSLSLLFSLFISFFFFFFSSP